jgi:phosphate-selective porin OprO and OprP
LIRQQAADSQFWSRVCGTHDESSRVGLQSHSIALVLLVGTRLQSGGGSAGIRKCGGPAAIEQPGTQVMARGRRTICIIAQLSFCALVHLLPLAAQAQLLTAPPQSDQPMPDPAQTPVSDNYAWDKNVVDGTTTAAEPPAAEQSLAKRVEALEHYIQQQQKAPALATETLPAPAKKEAKEDKASSPTGECVPKKVDTIIKPTFQLTGRIYFDGVTYDDDDAVTEFFNTDRDNEFGLRQFRLGAKGNIYENLIYNVEFEIRGTNSAITFKDIYMEQQELPFIGHLRAGHFKEPIGLEEFTSDLYLTFMEKSPATNTFAPARNFGVMAWDTFDECQDASWFAGLFRADSPDSPTNTGLWRSDNNDWCFDTRLAWLPFYDDPSNGRYLVHLGGSYSFRHVGALTPTATFNQNVAYSTLNGLAEFSTRPWVGTQAPIGFGTEADSDEWNQVDAEFLVIWGSASLQSEYFQILMNGGEQFNGGYAFLSYFLTGESRSYRKDLKTIDRTQPFEPFFWVNTAQGQCCGWGAWEIALGYSWVNLDDGHDTVVTVPPNSTNRLRGFNNNVVAGVNWYQNPWSRMFFDYTLELVDFVDPGVPSSNASIFGIRWQIDW